MRGVISLSVLFLVTVAAAADWPDRIDVFVRDGMDVDTPVSGVAVTVHEIGALERWEDELSANLSRDPDTARRQATERLAALTGENKRRLAAAWQGLLEAQRWGIRRVPAIVINDGEAVVYGTTDVSAAVARWRDWQEQTQ